MLAVDAELKKQSKPLKKLLGLLQFRQTETKNGNIIPDAMEKVRRQGVITLKYGKH